MKRRVATFAACLIVLGLNAVLAVRLYAISDAPEMERGLQTTLHGRLGPSAEPLNRAADRRMLRAVDELNDRTRPAAERLAAYREQVVRTERLALRSLAAQPAQATALAILAAARFELDPPTSPEAAADHLELIHLAARVTPTSPAAQIRLGDVLISMGRQDDALLRMRRAVELDPRVLRQAIGVLREHLVDPERILHAMPSRREALVALASAYYDEGLESVYADRLEGELDDPSPQLLRAYGDTCVRGRQLARLRDTLDRMGGSPDPDIEAERLLQASLAKRKLGDVDAALAQARSAHALRPEDPRFEEHVGQLALAAGETEEALRAFRAALRLHARQSGDPRARARLYSEIGQAEEVRRKVDRAYDAYRRAVRLDPREPVARTRLAQMEGAAGSPSR